MKFPALAKVILASLFFVFCFLFIKAPVFAQSQSQTTQPQQVQQVIDLNTNPDVPRNLHNFTQNVMIEVMSAMICQISGIDVTNTSQSCLGVDAKTKKIGFVKDGGGLIGVLQSSIITLYTPPLHTGDYFTYLTSNFGLAKPSLAASNDLGYQSLSPLSNLWMLARNVAYLFFVLIFLIIGIGIMLRIHIDPRTVMSIQNQIPKIIIAIILVTFSFALAGFLVDMMYVTCYVLLGVLAQADSSLASNLVVSLVSSSNPFMAANTALTIHAINIPILGTFDFGVFELAIQPAGQAATFVGNLFSNPTGGLLTAAIGALLGYLLAHTVGSAAGGIAGLITGGIVIGSALLTGGLSLPVLAAAGTIAAFTSSFTTAAFSAAGGIAGALAGSTLLATVAGVITFLIILIAILTTLFRLWFQLIVAYISILLNVVFAPIWIMLGLIPTSKISFSTWIRNLVGNLSCFPTALVMFLLARIFIDAFAGSNPGFFVAPLVGNPLDLHSFSAIIGMGVFLMTPSAVTSVKNAISGSSGITFGGVGQGISAGVAIPMAGIKGVIATSTKTTKPGERRGWKALFGAA